ncbi:hypothetical protein BH09PSE1_BH09PSE1_05060 [soil metagenome]
MLLVAHLIGGGSDRIAASAFTAATSSALLVLCLSDRQPYAPKYLRSLLWAGVPFCCLLAFVALSVIPGSNVLSVGPISKVIAARSLSVDPSATGLELFKFLGLGATLLVAERLATSARRLRRMLRALIWIGVIWTLWAIVLLALDVGASGIGRLSGAFISPNVAGALIVVTLLLLVGDNPPRDRSPSGAPASLKRFAPALLAVILIVGLVLTASRACAGLGVILSGLLWIWPRRVALLNTLKGRGSLRFIAGLGATAGISAAVFAGATLMSRLPRTTADAQDRWAIMKTYAAAAAESPLAGYGMGSASALSRLLITRDNYDVFWNIRAPHNLMVQWWVEGGFIGLGLIVATLVVIVVRTLSGLGARGRLAMSGPLTAMLFLALHGMLDYDLQIYSIALTGTFLMGLCLAGSACSQNYWSRFLRRSRRKRHPTADDASPNAGPEDRFFEE